MLDHILLLIGYTIVAMFWLAMVFLVRAAYRGVRARRWSRVLGFLGIAIALATGGLFLGLTPGSAAFYRYLDTRSYFGRGFFLGSPYLSYDSPRFFSGDGYSIEVFRISDSLARWASSPPATFTTEYPLKPSYRSHWTSLHWCPTPVAAEDRKLLDFALESTESDTDVLAAQTLLKRLANETGNYISAFYFMHGDSVGNVDLFLLSPGEHILIRVNFNT